MGLKPFDAGEDDDSDEEDIRCTLARITLPGVRALRRIRDDIFRIAEARGWVITGGWAHHAYLGDVYDTSCFSVSDVDIICVDPMSEFERITARKPPRPFKFRMVGGMTPNVFHLSLVGVSPYLIDVVAATASALNHIPMRYATLPTTASTTSARFLTLDPMIELCTLLSMNNDLFNGVMKHAPSDVEKRRRISDKLRERILSERAAQPPPPLPPTPVSRITRGSGGSGGEESLCDVIARAGYSNLAARVSDNEVVVVASDAYDVLHVVVEHFSTTRGNDGEVELALFAPFVWAEAFVLCAEVRAAASPDRALGRVFVRATPPPVRSGRRRETHVGDDGSPLKSPPPDLSLGALARFLVVTSAWRRSLGDEAGALASWARATDIISDPTTYKAAGRAARHYCGRLPSETVFATWLRTRTGTKVTAERDKVPYLRLDGRELKTFSCRALFEGGRDALVRAVTSVTPRHVMSIHLFSEANANAATPWRRRR